MSLAVNLLAAAWARLVLLGQGLGALAALAAELAGALFGAGALKDRVVKVLVRVEIQRQVFAVLRAFQPNLVLRKTLVTAYANTGTAIVTRAEDVCEVLIRDQDFEVVYAPRMGMITGGANFFLGMQNSADYTRDVANMRLAVRRDDVPAIIAPFLAQRAAAIVEAAPGRLDAPQDLTLPVAARLLDAYFGVGGPTEASLIDWTTTLFWYLFIDLRADAGLDARAVTAAQVGRDYLDQAIAARKAAPTEADDVLNRCLAMQKAGLPGMDDRAIRDNLIGLMIGEVPTTSKAAILALDQLLDRPGALAGAQAAARADDDAALAAHVFEALRFNPVNPLIYRIAVRDTLIAANTARARWVPKSTLVMACNLSAMFDPLQLASPSRFRADRPWGDYMLWGYGLHTCFGAHINRASIPALLKPLLRKPNLRRAAGEAGRIDLAGTPFPAHMMVEFD